MRGANDVFPSCLQLEGSLQHLAAPLSCAWDYQEMPIAYRLPRGTKNVSTYCYTILECNLSTKKTNGAASMIRRLTVYS